MYEPYVISCGHTYCYSCLCTWFATSKKKTCPNCREIVTQPPAPSYILKDMIHVFMDARRHLPQDETFDQHAAWAREESEMVHADKDNEDSKTGGLFKGVFRTRRERLLPIHDPVDHVDRCPHCNWEIEDGMCAQCGVHMDDWSSTDSDDSSSDMHGEPIPDDFEDEDLDADADFGEFDMDFTPEEYDTWMRTHNILEPGGSDDEQTRTEARAVRQELMRQMINRHRHQNRFPDWNQRFMDDEASEDEISGIDLNEEDEEELDDEDAGSIDEFLDDRDINDMTAYTISSPTANNDTPARHRRHQHQHRRERNSDIYSQGEASIDISSDDSDSDSDGVRHNPHFHRPAAPISIPSDDDEEPVAPTRRSRAIRILDSEEENNSEEEALPPPRRPRPTQILDSDDENSASESSSDEEQEAEILGNPPGRRQHSYPHHTHQPPAHRYPPIQYLDSDDRDIDKSSDYTAERRQEPIDPGSITDTSSDDYDSDAVVRTGAGAANFSPMSEGEGEQEGQMGYFDVYGEEEGEDEDGEGGEYGDHDDY
jgi:hypothetical protein